MAIPDADARWREATVQAAQPQTARVRSLFLRVPGWRGHVPGQHVDLRLTAEDGYQARRGYSIASAPDAALVEIAVERLDDGEVSPFLHDVAAPGDAIDLRGPLGGHFTWLEQQGGPLLLVGGGSGVVPLMAMLRHRALAAAALPALLLYSARHWDELCFREELLRHEQEEAALTVLFALTRDAVRRGQDFARRIDDAMLGTALARLGPAVKLAYVCGSTPFVEAAAGALLRLGLAPSSIRTERYGGTAPSVAAVG